MSSESSSIQPSLGITWLQLAGGMKKGDYQNLEGLQEAKTKIGNKYNAVQLSIKAEGKHCTCHSIVLAVLALVAAGAAIACLYFSGGPADLQLFIPGILLGVISLGFTAWMITKIVQAIQHRKAQALDLQETAEGSPLTNQQVLASMEKQEAQSENIKKALLALKTEQRKEFIKWVHNEYYGAGKPALTDDKKKVIQSFAAFPVTLADTQFEMDRAFAVEILTHIKPDHILLEEGDREIGTELFTKLFAKVGYPKQEEVAAFTVIYARHPLGLSMLAQNEPAQCHPAFVAACYAKMDDAQRTVFLQAMGDKLDILKLDALGEHPRDTKTEQRVLHEAVAPCIEITLIHEFSNKFLTGRIKEDSSEEEKTAFAQDKALLAAVARWPHEAAHRIYCHQDPRSLDTDFINALGENMSDDRKEQFIATATDSITKVQNQGQAAKGIVAVLTHYAENNVVMPELTQKIFARVPVLMAHVSQHVKTQLQKDIFKKITGKMNSKERVALLETEKKHYANAFKLRMSSWLKGLIPQEKRVNIAKHTVTAYFKDHPEDFKELVLTNKELGDDQARSSIALDILEHMDKEAEKVIHMMDDSEKGFPYFNYLTNMLVDQTKGRDLAKNPVPESRAHLIARFKYAPGTDREFKIEESRGKWTFSVDKSWDLKQDSGDWTNFTTIALTQKDHVWKK